MPYLISEIAQAHEGSLGIAHSYIDALAETGVDAIKFQTHIAAAESSAAEQFRVPFSYEDKSRFDYWKRMEFTPEQWAGLKAHVESRGMEFISSPFSVAAVDLLERLGVARYKIGSGELSNYLMLDRIGRTGKPVMLSSGMSDWAELQATIEFLKPYGNPLSLMQCTTAYPTVPEQWGLGVMQEMRERFQLPVGFSDHSGSIVAGLAAAALGASLLEFHVVFDRRMFGPDTKASLTIDEVKQLVDGVRIISRSLAHTYDKTAIESYAVLREMFGKSLAVNKDLEAGHILRVEDLESKKPANMGISAKEFQVVVGRRLKRALPCGAFLNRADISLE